MLARIYDFERREFRPLRGPSDSENYRNLQSRLRISNPGTRNGSTRRSATIRQQPRRRQPENLPMLQSSNANNGLSGNFGNANPQTQRAQPRPWGYQNPPHPNARHVLESWNDNTHYQPHLYQPESRQPHVLQGPRTKYGLGSSDGDIQFQASLAQPGPSGPSRSQDLDLGTTAGDIFDDSPSQSQLGHAGLQEPHVLPSDRSQPVHGSILEDFHSQPLFTYSEPEPPLGPQEPVTEQLVPSIDDNSSFQPILALPEPPIGHILGTEVSEPILENVSGHAPYQPRLDDPEPPNGHATQASGSESILESVIDHAPFQPLANHSEPQDLGGLPSANSKTVLGSIDDHAPFQPHLEQLEPDDTQPLPDQTSTAHAAANNNHDNGIQPLLGQSEHESDEPPEGINYGNQSQLSPEQPDQEEPPESPSAVFFPWKGVGLYDDTSTTLTSNSILASSIHSCDLCGDVIEEIEIRWSPREKMCRRCYDVATEFRRAQYTLREGGIEEESRRVHELRATEPEETTDPPPTTERSESSPDPDSITPTGTQCGECGKDTLRGVQLGKKWWCLDCSESKSSGSKNQWFWGGRSTESSQLGRQRAPRRRDRVKPVLPVDTSRNDSFAQAAESVPTPQLSYEVMELMYSGRLLETPTSYRPALAGNQRQSALSQQPLDLQEPPAPTPQLSAEVMELLASGLPVTPADTTSGQTEDIHHSPSPQQSLRSRTLAAQPPQQEPDAVEFAGPILPAMPADLTLASPGILPELWTSRGSEQAGSMQHESSTQEPVQSPGSGSQASPMGLFGMAFPTDPQEGAENVLDES